MNRSTSLRLLAALAGASLTASLHAAVLVDETFAAGERSNLNLPNGAQWFSSSGGTSITYTPNTSIKLTTGASGRHLLAYFTADGSAAALTNTGDSLSVSFTFSLDGAAGASATNTTAMRIGLFDSTAGNRIAADGLNATDTFDNYTGYIAAMAPGTSVASGLSLRERTTLTGANLISSTTAYTAFSGSAASQAFTYGSTYTGVFSVTKTATGVDLGIAFTGLGLSSYSLVKSDSTPVTAFDTFVFHNVSNVADSITITDLVVTHTSAIPEPSSFAALAGLGVLGLAASRRRRA